MQKKFFSWFQGAIEFIKHDCLLPKDTSKRQQLKKYMGKMKEFWQEKYYLNALKSM